MWNQSVLSIPRAEAARSPCGNAETIFNQRPWRLIYGPAKLRIVLIQHSKSVHRLFDNGP